MKKKRAHFGTKRANLETKRALLEEKTANFCFVLLNAVRELCFEGSESCIGASFKNLRVFIVVECEGIAEKCASLAG